MAQEKGCIKVSSSHGSGAVDCGYDGQNLCFRAESNRCGQLSWRQSCWFWEAGKSLVTRVCHPCVCPPVRSSMTEHVVQDMVQRIALMEEHMNTAGLRAEAAENCARAADTAATTAAGAAGVRQGTVPTSPDRWGNLERSVERKAWWTEIQNHVDVFENILRRHLLRSLYPPSEKKENTSHSRIFRRVQIVKSAGARKLREFLAETIQKTRVATYRARQNSMTKSQQITKSSLRQRSRDRNIGMLLWYTFFVAQWLQSYPCKTTTSQETVNSLRKFIEAEEDQKVVCTGNSLGFIKACEDLCWNHCMSTPHRSETERYCRKSSQKSQRRHFNCSRTVRIG